MHNRDVLLPGRELRELSEELRRLFADLEQAFTGPFASTSWDFVPPIDVLETEETIEILADLPGVAASDLRVLLKKGVLIIAGAKLPADQKSRTEASFHLVERGFGRFARAVQVAGAIDGGRARAVLRAGELRISIPKIVERRGREILVPIREEPAE
jgi:HSP20 family protein